MITYKKFFETLKQKNISQYQLIVYHGVNTSLLDRMKKGANITTATLDRLCQILDCNIEDIVSYSPDPKKISIEIADVAENNREPKN